MKVLLVVHLFLPDYFAGTEILTLHTAHELRSRGHEVEVFTAFPGVSDMSDQERFDRYVFEGIPVTRFKHAHSPMDGQNNVAEQEYDNSLVARHFEGLLKEFQPDVVHFFHLMRISASIVDVCLRWHVPTVLTPTDFWFVCPTSQLRLPDGSMCPGPDPTGGNCVGHLASLKLPRTAARVMRFLPSAVVRSAVHMAGLGLFKGLGPLKLVAALSRRQGFLRDRLNRIDRVLVPTQFMHDTLQRNGLNPTHVQHCAYGIRLPHMAPRGQCSTGPLRLGVIGVGEHKGAHILIEAVRKLGHVDLLVRIYGRPSDAPNHMRRLTALATGDPRIAFCGSFPNDRIGDILSELDVLVVPSIWFENAPLVIYSAQAAGLPVIASNVAGVAEMITENDNGCLFPPGDVDSLAAIINRLANDRGQVSRLSERARMPKTIATYTDELLSVYEEIGTAGRHRS
jgi:glycosyltransferase involved in cell wall biosynthesis